MTVADATNRGRNFFAVAVLAILCTSAIHGLQTAAEVGPVLAELAFAATGILGVGWYLRGRNRYRRSVFPLALVGLALLAKVARMWLIFGGLVVGGSDFGIAALLAEILIVVTAQLLLTREPSPRGY